MSDAEPRHSLPAPLIALCGWIFPGLGYVLIGQRFRGLIAGGTILLTFLLGLLIGGVRVVDVPGYDPAGQAKMVRMAGIGESAWALKVDFRGEVMNKPWYIAQMLIGPTNLVATWGSLAAAAANHRMSTARVFDIGTLYTAVAGMLNLLVIIDATYRSTYAPTPEFGSPDIDPGEAARSETDRDLADAAAVTAGVQQANSPSVRGGQS